LENTSNKIFRVLGLMSGTSLDGLDMAICEFYQQDKSFSFKILNSKTVEYSAEWKYNLNNAINLSAAKYFELNSFYGKFIAKEVNNFLTNCQIKPQAIASHGHTVFHQPNLGFSTQIGCGATISANTGLTTICDFRSLDVANDGQGAPLVPIGDKLLFSDYDACLNIGGIANISFESTKNRLAYDICEANMLLNFLAEKIGQSYDKDGQLARVGNVNHELLKKLNNQDYYTETGAKSLGREWFETTNLILIQNTDLSINDLLATASEHVAQIIANEINRHGLKKVLVTGGGAFNTFLMELIKAKTISEIIIPDSSIINFKEALIFAFLGYLRLNHITNTLCSVTGAKTNSIGGAVYLGKSENYL
jgi:anhydro-N-acetylmuramic acid kinase